MQNLHPSTQKNLLKGATLTKPYEKFVEALDSSRQDSFLVADWLIKKNFSGVRILPASTRKESERWQDHTDSGDIEVRMRVEVKRWPKIDFLSLADIPYKNIIVDEAYKIAKFPVATLYGYFILNASRSACMFISSRTRSEWVEEEKYDNLDKSNKKFVFCPKSLVSFHKLGE